MKAEAEFLKEFNIKKDEFKATGLAWKDLAKIHEDYQGKRDQYLPTAKDIAERLLQVKAVHSVKYRIKDADHLIEKIIRKKIERPDDEFTLDNYAIAITDIIGVRALHLFKEDWQTIDDFIRKTWKLKEKPTANVRKGDPEEIIKAFKEKGCKIKNHPHGYRSVHYSLKTTPTRTEFVSELQVRTIFEEGWSEIDHAIRYPYQVNNVALAGYLTVFNRVAGNADEMGNYLRYLQKELSGRDKELELKKTEIDELRNEIKDLKISVGEKKKLQERIDRIIADSSAAVASPSQFTVYGSTVFGNNMFDPSNPGSYLQPYVVSVQMKQCRQCGKPYQPSTALVDQGLCHTCSLFSPALTLKP